MNTEYWDWLWKLGTAGVAVAVTVYSWWTQRNKATHDHITAAKAACDKKADEHEKRLVDLEAAVTGSPTHQDLGKVYEKLNQTNENLNQLIGQNKGIARAVENMQSYLMEKDK